MRHKPKPEQHADPSLRAIGRENSTRHCDHGKSSIWRQHKSTKDPRTALTAEGMTNRMRVDMEQRTCDAPNCTKPRYQRRKWCSTHAMRMHRYGVLDYTPPRRDDKLEGQRFGSLTVIRRIDATWECSCDCGAVTVTRSGDLNRGSALSCGNSRVHHRIESPGYRATHDRLQRDRGSASKHHCIDCGHQAQQWSYDHTDPFQLLSSDGLPYSTDPSHYQPRCVPCHKMYDLTR